MKINYNEEDQFINNSDEYTDKYLKSIYRYYIKGGYKGLLSNIIKNIIINIFTLLFSTFILLMIDWTKIIDCEKNDCNELNDILYKKAFNINGFKDYFVITYFIIYSFDCFFKLIKNIRYIKENNKIKKLFYDDLKITDEILRGMKWNDILKELVYKHNNEEVKIFSNWYKITPYMINHSILRIDNYIVGLFNNNTLKLKILNIEFTENYINEDMEWYLKYIIDRLYINKRLINQSELKKENKIKMILKIICIINILLIPYKIINYLLFFLFNHAEDMRSKRENKDISRLDWTLYAKWKFKEYNELDYKFDKRIQASYKYADMYKKQYLKPVLNSINETLIYISKSLLSLIILITLIDDNLLIKMNILDKNLLWYIAFFTIILTFSRNSISEQKHLIYCSDKIMKNLSIYTHYYPEKWKKNCNKIFVRKEFDKLYVSKVTILIYDLIYIILSPILYLNSINKSINKIYKFIKKNTEYINGVGDVCSYSNFNNDINEKITGNINNKLVNSVINYKISNPDWKLEVNNNFMKEIEEMEIKQNENKSLDDYFLKYNDDKKLDTYLYKINNNYEMYN